MNNVVAMGVASPSFEIPWSRQTIPLFIRPSESGGLGVVEFININQTREI